MRATEVRYERLAMVGRFESVRVGMTVALDEGDALEDGIGMARDFVERNLRLAGAVLPEDTGERGNK